MAVIILSVLIVVAVLALIIGGISKLGGKTATHGATGTFQLPPGARIVEMQSQPGRLILRVREAHGEEIEKVIGWAQNVAANAGVGFDLPAPLLAA